MSTWVHISVVGSWIGFRSFKCPNCPVKFIVYQFGRHGLFGFGQSLMALGVRVDSANKSTILHPGHQLVHGTWAMKWVSGIWIKWSVQNCTKKRGADSSLESSFPHGLVHQIINNAPHRLKHGWCTRSLHRIWTHLINFEIIKCNSRAWAQNKRGPT